MSHASRTRRSFLKHSATAAAGTAAIPSLAAALGRSQPLGDRTLRVALVGCGGRGRGAASEALKTAGSVELVAMADAFSDQLEYAHQTISKAVPERVKVPEENRFVGFDAYARAMDAVGDKIDAETAAQWGMIWKCVDEDALMDEVMEFARHIATQPTRSIGLIKRALYASLGNDLDSQLDLERNLQRVAGYATDYRPGVQSFLAKLPAKFTRG